METKNPNKFKVQAQSNYTERAVVKWGYLSYVTIQVSNNDPFRSLHFSSFLLLFCLLLLF